ncbi:hypothetical protein VKT23_011985 [Stygiomarasmius scandens]|uniref:DUF6534 domain-containing protein n=1 Tax=Marasmiellus scandens TaxID=2682957 RepID=A0ABR1J808_9AGAR
MFEIISAYRYFHPNGTRTRDSKTLRALVATVVVVDTLNLIIACIDTYEFSITHYGDPSYLLKQYWRTPAWVSSGQFIAAVVQGFLAYRYIRLSRDWYGGTILMILVFIALGGGIACSVLVVKWSDLSQRPLLDKPVKVWIITDAVTDVAIAFAMVCKLWGQRSVFKDTNSMIYRLIANSIQSGTVTALFALAALISYLAKPASNDPVLFYWILSRLYVITLLFTLNVRDQMKRGITNTMSYSGSRSGDDRHGGAISAQGDVEGSAIGLGRIRVIKAVHTDISPPAIHNSDDKLPNYSDSETS